MRPEPCMSSDDDTQDIRLAPSAGRRSRIVEPPHDRHAPSSMGHADRSRRRRSRDFSEALRTLGRVFDNLETAQLQCSVLEAEKSQSQVATEKMLEGAFARIEDLEAVVAGLMRIVAKYDSLLSMSNGRRQEAEKRAVNAEIKVKETERGASEAVEWLYRYMSDSLHPEP